MKQQLCALQARDRASGEIKVEYYVLEYSSRDDFKRNFRKMVDYFTSQIGGGSHE